MLNNKIGVLIDYGRDVDLVEKFEKAKSMGIETCQLCIWDTTLYNSTYAKIVRDAVEKTGFTITSLWSGWSGPCEWNFTYGPATIGLVPQTYRYQRLQELMRAADFALEIGVDRVISHAGFIPENPDIPDFAGTVGALRQLCNYMKRRGQYFLFETGQETPVTMLRTIQAIGTGNVGINFDTANLILYGKANTLDALDVFGKYVMETHFKDGVYPTDGYGLGEETPLGQGKANIGAVIKKLAELGFEGSFTIEREISGEDQIRDIKMARELIKGYMAEC